MRSRIHCTSDTSPYHLYNMGSLRLLASVFLILHSQVLACEFDSDCSDGEKCCNYNCYETPDCNGYSCATDEQCGDTSTLSCCQRRCVWGSNCLGYSCASSMDCSSAEYCCYDGSCCDQTTYRVLLIVLIVGCVFGAGIVCGLCTIFWVCRRRTRNRGQVIANRRIAQTTATYGSTSCGNQAMPPQAQHYCGGVPPENYQPYPSTQGGRPNMGFQSQYPVTSAAPAQQVAPSAYLDAVRSEGFQQHVGASGPHPKPSAPHSE